MFVSIITFTNEKWSYEWSGVPGNPVSYAYTTLSTIGMTQRSASSYPMQTVINKPGYLGHV
jgi:hypothetical protein